MDRHVQLIAFLWIALGILTFFLGSIAVILFFGISFIPDIGKEGPLILRTIAFFGGGFFLLLSIPKVIAGVGLIKRHEWGRILTLILSFFALLNFPLGTILAVYSFIILTKEETVKLFK